MDNLFTEKVRAIGIDSKDQEYYRQGRRKPFIINHLMIK
jgi:hypothetical protein